MFLGKVVLKICSKFTWKHPCWSVNSIKLLCNFIEITLCHGCSPINTLIKLFLNMNTVFAKVVIHNIAYLWWLWNKKKAFGKDGLRGTLLAYLSTPLSMISWRFLGAYGLDSHSLSFIFSYLNEKKNKNQFRT